VARIRSSRWWIGLTAILASVFLGSAAILIAWDWPQPAGAGPEPSIIYVTASQAPTVIVHPAPLDSEPLTDVTLGSINDGWILVEYDSSAGTFAPPPVTVTPSPDEEGAASPFEIPGSGPSEWEIPGTRYLYAVDPSGTAYEAANLGSETGLRLVLWLPDLRTVIVEEQDGGGASFRTFDLVTGALSGRFLGPGGSASRTWIDPELRLARDGDGVWVSFDNGSGARGLNRIGFDGSPEIELVSPKDLAGFIESADGSTIVTVEGASGPNWTVVSYSEPGTSVFPEPVVAASPSPTPEASPEATPAPAGPSKPEVTITSEGYERAAHGMPPGETNCYPASWPEDRQLLIACTEEDESLVLYTLALATSTFVDVATFPSNGDSSTLLFSDDGTRIVRLPDIVNAIGDPVWTLPTGESRPIGLVWAGDYLVTWGDTQDPPDLGYGAGALYVRHSSKGEGAYALRANPGAAGFGTVVPAPPVEPEL